MSKQIPNNIKLSIPPTTYLFLKTVFFKNIVNENSCCFCNLLTKPFVDIINLNIVNILYIMLNHFSKPYFAYVIQIPSYSSLAF